MNLVLLYPEELHGENLAVVTGDHAAYLHEFHDLEVGRTVRAGVIDGSIGSATVVHCDKNHFEFEVKLGEPPLSLLKTSLLVAVPRPQIIKKIFQTCAMLGVESIALAGAQLGDRSYLQSKALKPENILREITKGLEQSSTTRAPKVTIYRDFFAFGRESPAQQANQSNSIKLVASTSPESTPLTRHAPIPRDQAALLAVGPETGWSSAELSLFDKLGFTPVSLGPRILRVEIAVTAAIAQIEGLRASNSGSIQ